MSGDSAELARAWEDALLALGPSLSEEDWSKAMRVAQPTETDEEDDYSDAANEFEEAAGPYCLGQLYIEFPRSTHGDGASVHVYLLPGGSAVGTLFATWEVERSGFILEDADLEGVLSEAKNLLFSVQDGADWDDMGEWDDDRDQSRAPSIERGGVAEIRAAWAARLAGAEK